MWSRCFRWMTHFAVRTLNLPPVVVLPSTSFKCDVMFGINGLLRRCCQNWKYPCLGSSFCLIVMGTCQNKSFSTPRQQVMATFSSAQVKTFSSVRIPVSIQLPSNYVYFISVRGVSNGWYGSGVCDTFFITEGFYSGRPLPSPPMQQWDTRPV